MLTVERRPGLHDDRRLRAIRAARDPRRRFVVRGAGSKLGPPWTHERRTAIRGPQRRRHDPAAPARRRDGTGAPGRWHDRSCPARRSHSRAPAPFRPSCKRTRDRMEHSGSRGFPPVEFTLTASDPARRLHGDGERTSDLRERSRRPHRSRWRRSGLLRVTLRDTGGQPATNATATVSARREFSAHGGGRCQRQFTFDFLSLGTYRVVGRFARQHRQRRSDDGDDQYRRPDLRGHLYVPRRRDSAVTVVAPDGVSPCRSAQCRAQRQRRSRWRSDSARSPPRSSASPTPSGSSPSRTFPSGIRHWRGGRAWRRQQRRLVGPRARRPP